MNFYVECSSWLMLLRVGCGYTAGQEPPAGAQQATATTAPRTPITRPVRPARQDVRVNDTLVLECRRPYTTLPLYQKPALTVWSHLALRGRRGYYEVLSYPDTLSWYCLYQCQSEALVSARGDVLHFSVLEGGRLPWEDVRRGQPLPDDAVYELDRWVWDVRYRQFAQYLTADLKALGRRDAACFTGGSAGDLTPEEYRLLPHWIRQEQARGKRLHRLPPTQRLLAYSTFSRELATAASPQYRRGYGPLLLNLLRAWRTYPMPAATARHLDRSIQALAAASRQAAGRSGKNRLTGSFK